MLLCFVQLQIRISIHMFFLQGEDYDTKFIEYSVYHMMCRIPEL